MARTKRTYPSIGHYNPERTVGPPVRHMSAGQWLISTRYIVGWRDAGIIKVGSTLFGRQRYVKFLSRGAEVVDVARYPELIDSLHAEYWLMRRLRRDYEPAFAEKSEAVDYLPLGGGWTECYRVDPSEWDRVVEIAHESTENI